MARKKKSAPRKDGASAPAPAAVPALGYVRACMQVHGTAYTLVAFCSALSEGGPYAKRLAITLERYHAIALEVDKEEYYAKETTR